LKKDIFVCLIYYVEFLMAFPCIYGLYPELVHPLYFSTSVLFLWWFQQAKKFYIHFCIESTSTIFTLTSCFYPPPPVSALLAWPFFHSCPSLFGCLFVGQWGFCLGFIPVNALCLSQCNPLHCTSWPFPFYLCCSTVFSVFHCVWFLLRCDIFHRHSLSFHKLTSSNAFEGSYFCLQRKREGKYTYCVSIYLWHPKLWSRYYHHPSF
jgi:hypothetical protein